VNAEPLLSRFRDDPDYQELLTDFVAGMADRRQTLTTALATGNWDDLRRQAHQLKGACGGYGFDSVSRAAADLEDACRKAPPNPDELARLLDLILNDVGRMVA
jgi:histidine phosphotransfer protein HptB